jgi:putative endopeptidase
MKKKSWGFDPKDMDKNVRPQDDFYHYAGGNWLKKNPIPKTESRWGSFTILRYETEKRLKTILEELGKQKNPQVNSPEQMVGDFYHSGMDIKKRNKLSIKPISQYLKTIEEIKTTEDLLYSVSNFHKIGINTLWWNDVDQDMKSSDKNILYVGQGGLGMSDKDYYLKNDKESLRIRNAYLLHMEAMLSLLGLEKKYLKESVGKIYKIEHRLAKASMSKEDVHEVEKIYNKKTISQLKKVAPKIDWVKYFKIIGVNKIENLIVCQPKFFTEVSASIKEVSIEDWRLYLKWHLLRSTSRFLSKPFLRENFNFYGKVILGTKEMKPLWRQVLSVVDGGLDELVGKTYVKKYFDSETKKKANSMVNDLFIAYEQRIKKLDWMGPKTKKMALKKLHAMNRKIGYPDKWKSYHGLRVDGSDYLGNVIRISTFEHRRMIKKIGKPVDRKEWHMSPQTVNAYCSQTMNEIVFPAAILQLPFFNKNIDDAINYGAMGMVIGHEMTHNFDDQGSKFDTKGNLKNWWTKSDHENLRKKTKPLIAQFSKYKVADGVSVNGTLTVGENIADLGGLAIAFDAYQLHLKKVGRKNIDGFTPEQRFFLGDTLFERENTSPEFAKMVAINDPHSPSIFRVNGPASNLSEFYEAFNVKKGDKLYREPKDRVKIW